jgi:hypothetical protein
MDFTATLAIAFGSLVPQLPSIVVMIVGIILALSRWNKHPKISMLIVIALALDIAISLIFPIVQAAVIGSGARGSEVGLIFAVWGITSGLLRAAALGLLVWAGLGWREGTVG